jgi:hypothetical protein
MNLIQRFGLGVVLVFLIGFLAGGFACYRFQKHQISEAVQLGGFIHDGQIYNINLKP